LKLAVHKLKTWPLYFAAIVSGAKTFEVRKNDREFLVGDSLFLMEFCPKDESYTGRQWVVIITYIFKGGAFGVDSSFSVLGIRQLSTAELVIEQNGRTTGNSTPKTPPRGEIKPECRSCGRSYQCTFDRGSASCKLTYVPV
jgi:hypothetical protein